MSQHDFIIANQTASSARSDINSGLQALASNNSGASAPTTTYANMWWYDTGANLLKIRNEGDSAWINVAYVNQSTNKFEILDDTKVVTTSGTQAGLLGDQTTATWQTGTGTTESLVSPAKVKAAIESLALSIGATSQTWQDVTSNRSINTVYYNDTGRPIMVSYGINGNNFAGETRWTLFTGPTSNPTGEAARASTFNVHDYSGNSSAIVPIDHYYKIQRTGYSTSYTLYWLELR